MKKPKIIGQWIIDGVIQPMYQFDFTKNFLDEMPNRKEYKELDLDVTRDFVEVIPEMLEDDILFEEHVKGKTVDIP